MNAQNALTMLEANGFTIKLSPDDRIIIRCPVDKASSFDHEKYLDIIRRCKDEAIRFLRCRALLREGFQQALPYVAPRILVTRDINAAIEIGLAIQAGKATLSGPVIYNLSNGEIEVQYSTLVPDEWLEFTHPENL